MLTRDKLIREYRARSGTLASLLIVYGTIIATMTITALAII